MIKYSEGLLGQFHEDYVFWNGVTVLVKISMGQISGIVSKVFCQFIGLYSELVIDGVDDGLFTGQARVNIYS